LGSEWGADANVQRKRARAGHAWLLELRQLRDKALARCDAVRAEELQAEIEEVTARLDGIVEAAR
jgi:hypothetical protein